MSRPSINIGLKKLRSSTSSAPDHKSRNPFKLLRKSHKPRWGVYPLIQLNDSLENSTKGFPSNKVSTTKYTLLNFFPKNLFEQFRRATNFYFLLITILTLIPSISPLTPITSIAPLIFVLGVTAIKEAFEDYRRFVADKKVNNRTYKVIQPDGNRSIVMSKDLKVGDLLLLEKNETFPADLILLTSSLDDGVCYIETSQLDGESNLKMLRALPETSRFTEEDVRLLKATIACEEPHHNLYVFNANITINERQYAFDVKQLLLRGAGLRNTDWALAVVAYTGMDTKLSLNQRSPPSKFSTIEKKMNNIVVAIFTFKMIAALICGILSGIWQATNASKMWYLGSYSDTNGGETGVLDFFSYFILFSFLLPQSMMVTLEVVKVVQAQWMEWDKEFRIDPKDPYSGMSAKTSNLNDELALVKYIFSDKTGTLTQNKMEFSQCSVNGVVYHNPTAGDLKASLENTTWRSDSSDSHSTYIAEYLRALALCHTVVPEPADDGIVYKAQSPDEAALCEAARVNEFIFLRRKTTNITITELGDERTYDLLNTIEFTSDRARMSVIVRSPEGKIILYCKGADSRMIPRIREEDKETLNQTKQHLAQFSQEGLRTLIIASKQISEEEYASWNEKYNSAMVDLSEARSQRILEITEEIEQNLSLIGCTAIEDKLQDGVPETIKYLLEAGIRIWVITGDKQETAINIGYSTNLLQPELPLVIVNADNSVHCQKLLEAAIDEYEPKKTEIGLVIDGASLIYAIGDHSSLLLRVAKLARSVVCCRVTPLQKAQVVQLVKNDSKETCLAIGDGANDVSMIQAAHIGIGIFGKEGTQAARASDYAIQQFSHLQHLLVIHGRYSIIRNSMLIQSSFYKNMAFFFVQFWFAMWNGFSALTIYDDWIVTAFNIILTSAPPFFLAIFEKDVQEFVIVKHPPLYKEVQDGRHFTYKTLFMWLSSAFWHSFVFYYVPLLVFLNDVQHSNGKVYGLESWSLITSTSAVIVVLFKIALETNYWTLLNYVGHWGSLLVYVLLIFVLSYLDTWWPPMYHVFQTVVTLPSFWLTIALVFLICLVPDFALKYWKRQYYPENWQILQEKYTTIASREEKSLELSTLRKSGIVRNDSEQSIESEKL